MGSSNRACGISKVAINPGDKVKLFYIVSNAPLYYARAIGTEYHHYSKHLGISDNPTDTYKILGLAMDAQYDDYGRYSVINEQDLAVRYNIEIIKSKFTRTEGGKFSDVDTSTFDFEKVQDILMECELFLDSSKDNNVRESIEYFAVLEDVYNEYVLNYIADEYKDGVYYQDTTQSMIDNSIQKRRLYEEKVNAEVELQFDSMSHMVGRTNKDGSVWSAEDVYDLIRISAQSKVEMDLDMRERYDDYSYRSGHRLDYFLQTMDTETRNCTEEEIEFFLAEQEKNRIMVYALMSNNFDIMPSRYAGQESDKTHQASTYAQLAETLFKNQIEENSKHDYTVTFKYVPGYIEMHINQILHFIDMYWCDDNKTKLKELYDYFSTLSENVMVQPNGKYEALSKIVNDTKVNILIVVKD